MAEDFRLPGSSYAELVKIVRAYQAAPQTASLNDVASLAAVHPTIVSRNNTFLVSIGILEEGRQKAVTPLGRELARALEYSMQEEVPRAWRDIVENNDFLSKLVTAVRIRGGMENTNLQAHIAYSAGQRKSPAVMTGASAVIEILKQARLIREDETGRLVASSSNDPQSKQSPVISTDVPSELAQQSRTRDGNFVPTSLPVAINIQIQCSPDDLGDLGEKILSFLASLQGDIASEKQDDTL